MVQTETAEKIKTHILFSIDLFENRAVYEILWTKESRGEQATDDSMGYAHCMLDN